MPSPPHPRDSDHRLHNYWFPKAKLSSGHVVEHVLAVTNIIVQILFIYGSWCFFSWQTTQNVEIGDAIFCFGSAFTVFSSVHSLLESRFRFKKIFDTSEDGEAEKFRDESLENLMFIAAAVAFAVGGVCYWPPFTKGMTEMEKKHTEAVGAWAFFIGSIGFLLAAFFNACGAAACKEERHPGGTRWYVHYIRQFALLNAQIGSILFACGSYFYRPGLTSHVCTLPKAEVTAAQNEICLNAGDVGTRMYVAGSVLFTIEALLGYICTWLIMLMPCEPWARSLDDDEDGFQSE